jgi:hypothetical protein
MKAEQTYSKSDNTYGTVLHWRPYEGSRSLSKYDFTVDFGVRDMGSSSNYFSIRSYHIMWGY